MKKGIRITLESRAPQMYPLQGHSHKFSYETEYTDAPLSDLINAFVSGLQSLTWCKETIVDALREYIYENDGLENELPSYESNKD